MSTTEQGFGRNGIHQTLRKTAATFWNCLPDLLLFDLLFKAVALLVLSPLVALLLDRFVATSGNTAVGNFDLIGFLATPFGVTLGLAILALSLAFAAADLAGLIAIAYGATLNRRVPYFQALTFVMASLGRLLAASFLTLILLALAALPFVLAGLFVASRLLSEHDINYYLDVQPAEFWSAVRWGTLFAVLACGASILVAVPLLFVLPEVLFGGTIRSAMAQSYRLAHGHRRRLILGLLAWIMLFQLASFVLNTVIYYTGYACVTAAGDATALFLTLLGTLTAVSLLANYLLAFATSASGCVLLARAYHQRAHRPVPAWESLPRLGNWPSWSTTRKTPLAVVLLLCVLATLAVRHVLLDVRWEDHIGVTAHRGASLSETENTLAAVARAIEEGATCVEIDVQRTSDGKIVLAHDADMMRLARSPLVINRSTFAELRAIRFSGHQLPTLDEVIDVVRGKVNLLVELKSYNYQSEELVADTVEVLRRREMLDEAVVMSLKLSEALAAQKIEPRLEVGFVTSATLGNLSRLDVDFLAVSRSQATDALIAAAHGQGKKIYVWTINQRPDMLRMIDRGVDNIITDDPALLVSILRERQDYSAPQRILLRFKTLYAR